MPQVLSLAEAVRRLGVSRQVVRRLADEGKIRTYVQPGLGYHRFVAADVDRLAAEGWAKAGVTDDATAGSEAQ